MSEKIVIKYIFCPRCARKIFDIKWYDYRKYRRADVYCSVCGEIYIIFGVIKKKEK